MPRGKNKPGMIVTKETGVHVIEEDFLPPQKTSRTKDVKAAGVRDADLPLISEMDAEDMATVVGLIEDAVAYKEQLKAIGEAMKKVKRDLAAMARIYKMDHGMRYAQSAIGIRFGMRRKSLDKGLLLLNGCPPDAILKSYKEGEEYDQVTVIPDMSKPEDSTSDD